MASALHANPSERDIEMHDSLTPTLQGLARQNLPLTLPWHPRETIKPGMIFSSLRADTDKPWSKLSPFKPRSLQETPIRFSRANGDVASYCSQSTSSRVENNEHMSVSLTVSVDALVASASVGGSYAKSVAKNTDANKTSVRSVFRSGTVLMDRVPSLTDEALIKLKYDGGLDAFKETYGDYYVAGYRLGVDNGLFVSYDGFAERNSETKALEASVKVLGIGRTHREFWTKSSELHNQSIRFVAYDTLDYIMIEKTVKAAGSMTALEKEVDDMSNKAQNIEQRCVKRLEDLHIRDGQTLEYEALDRITKAGLVAELVLLPISSIREVLDWTVDDNIIKL